MEDLDNLIEDYKRKINTVLSLKNDSNFDLKLKTKFECYRTFLVELERLKKNLSENV